MTSERWLHHYFIFYTEIGKSIH